MRSRVPYFERPRPPRDWRWWVGGLGRTLIVTGLLMFGFVAYQLWGTGIATARAQAELRRDLQSVIPTLPNNDTETTVAPTPSQPEDTTPTTLPRAEVAPSVPNGTGLGYIIIPKLELNWTFVEGVRQKDIELGPGHFKETPMPGQIGNVAIAGHRTTHGQPFYHLDKLVPGDEITLVTAQGRYTYAVTESLVVSPTDYAMVVPAFLPDTATLTLVTCTPAYTAQMRLIVRAVIVEEKSDQVYLPPDELPQADVITLPADNSSQGTAPANPSDTVPDPTATTLPAQNFDSAFAGGWFDDSAAFPQIALWGAALLATVIGSYYIGRRFRRLTVSFIVGVVPFTVALFFWYENINRLLPPGL